MTTIEFLFDFGSPTTYLAHQRLPAVVARTGATVDYVPVLLGGLFKATGNASPAMVPAKGRYMNADMARFAGREGIVLNPNPFFPINTLSLMRIAAGLKDDPRFMAYVDAVFDAMWAAPVNMGDPVVAAATLGRGRLRPGRAVRAGGRPGGQGPAQVGDRGGGGARRVRGADLLRGRRDVLRAGPARLGRGGSNPMKRPGGSLRRASVRSRPGGPG